jgi:hypothetical protein
MESTEESRTHTVGQRAADARDTIESARQDDSEFDATNCHLAKLTTVRTDSFKYQRSENGNELFALPDGSRDVTPEPPQVAAELDVYQTDWPASAGTDIAEDVEADFNEGLRVQLGESVYLVE